MSNSSLSNLMACLRLLGSEKSTERKKQFEILNVLLNKPQVIHSLDKNTDRKRRHPEKSNQQKVLVTWDQVFNGMKAFFEAETRKLGTVTLPLPTKFKTLKQTCCKLFKFVVETANARGPMLKAQSIIHIVLGVLGDRDLKQIFGAEFTAVLLKNVLLVKPLVLQISQQKYQSLLEVYSPLICSAPSFWNKSVLSDVFHQLLEHSQLCTINTKFVVNLLLKVFSPIKHEKASYHHEGLLSALLSFCKKSPVTLRQSICDLGEKLLAPLLHFWNNRPTELTKNLLLEFFYIQLVVHYPSGRLTPETGAFVNELPESWNLTLQELLTALLQECENVVDKGKLSDSKDALLRPEVVCVMVEVCHVVFSLSQYTPVNSELDVSVVASTSATQVTSFSTVTSKRRRHGYQFSLLMDPLRNSKDNQVITPWLQLIAALLTKYPESASSSDLLSLVDLLQSITGNLPPKQAQVRSWILICLRSIANAFAKTDAAATNSEQDYCAGSDVWKQVWEMTVRMVALNQCHEEAHSLLKQLISCKLVIPEIEFYRLYFPGANNRVSLASLETLLSYLQHFSFPSCSTQCNMPFSVTDPSRTQDFKGRYWFRHQLVQWVFPGSDESTDCLMIPDLDCPISLANLLVYICIQNGSIACFVPREVICRNACISLPKEWIWTKDLDSSLLKSTFDCALNESHVNSAVAVIPTKGKVTIQPVFDHLLTSVMYESGQLLDRFQELPTVCITNCICLLFNILNSALVQGVMSETDVKESRLGGFITRLLKKLVDCLVQTRDNEKMLELIEPLLSLTELEFSSENSKVIKNYLSELIPQELVDFLLALISSCSDSASPCTQLTGTTQLNGHSQSFVLNKSSQSSEELLDIEDILGDAGGIAENESLNLTFTAKEKPSSFNKLHSTAVVFLCKVYFQSSVSLVQRKLILQSLCGDDSELLNLPKAQLLLTGLPYMALSEPETCLRCIREILKAHQSRLETSSYLRCLEVIELCIPYVVKVSASNSQEVDSKDLFYFLLDTFWNREKQQQKDTHISLALVKLTAAVLKMLFSVQTEQLAVLENQKKSELVKNFMSLIVSSNQHIKLVAASFLPLFLSSMTPNVQETFFDEWCPSIINQSRVEEEGLTNDSCLLTSLYHLASASSTLERRALFAFLQAARIRNISHSLISKVLDQLSQQFSFPNRIHLLQYHLPYLVFQWLDLKYPLKEFPFTLMNYPTLGSFYREQSGLLVTLLFDQLDFVELRNLGQESGRDWITILKEAVPMMMAYFICWFVATDIPNVELKLKNAMKGHEFLVKHLTGSILDSEVSRQLQAIVTNILLLLNDDSISEGLPHLNLLLPPEGPISFPALVIQNALKYLIQSKVDKGIDSLLLTLAKTENGLPDVMLSLRLELFQAPRVNEECRILLVYLLLVELLLPDIHQHVKFGSLFVLREFLSIAVTEINRKASSSNRTGVRGISIYLMQTVIEGVVNKMPKEICEMLPSIVNSLVFVLKVEPVLEKSVCRLLNILFVKKMSLLKSGLAILDPLPRIPCLKELVEHQEKIIGKLDSLDTVLQNFWQRYKCRKGDISVEGLESLLSYIKEKKSGLKLMVRSFQNVHMFSDHLVESPLHLVISCLVKICTTGTSECRHIAAKCLGEIGPLDLGTTILYPLDNLMKDNPVGEKESNIECCIFIFSSLVDYFIDERPDVVKAAYKVLKSVMRSKMGQDMFGSKRLCSIGKHLIPFAVKEKAKLQPSRKPTAGEFSAVMDDNSMWSPKGVTHRQWVETLVCSLIDIGCSTSNHLFKHLKPLCKTEVTFCEKILPYLIHNILLENADNAVIGDILSKQISNFFSNHCQLVDCDGRLSSKHCTSAPGGDQNLIVRCRASVQTMLNVIEHLRKQKKCGNVPARDNNYWLNVNYLDIAMAAQFCSQHFNVLTYTELWCDVSNKVVLSSQSSDGSNSSQESVSTRQPLLSTLHSTYRAGLIQQLLLNAYRHVGDYDGLRGCSMLFEDSSLVQNSLFQVDNRWDRILQAQDAETVASAELSPAGSAVIMKALQKCGLNHTLQGYIRGLLTAGTEQQPVSDLLEFQSECAWRLGQWDLILPETSTTSGVHQSLYRSLIHLSSKGYACIDDVLEAGREHVLSDMRRKCYNQQAVHSLYPFLTDFKLFSLVESCNVFLKDTPVDKQSPLMNLLKELLSSNELPFFDFEHVEPYLCLQRILLQQLLNFGFSAAANALKTSLEHLLTLSRQHNHLQLADHTLQHLILVENQFGEQKLRMKVEEARNRWCRGELASARQILKMILQPLERQQEESPEKALLHAETLMQLGNWQAESCFESPATILSEFLEKAVNILELLQEHAKDSLWEGHLSVARYADLRFQGIRKHRQSQAFALKKQLMREAIEKAQKLREKRTGLTDGEKHAIKTLEKQSEIDAKEIQDLQTEYEGMLMKALQSYLQCLKGTDMHDLRAFRVVALWFESNNDRKVNELLGKELSSVATHKFLPLIYQLAARMSASDSAQFQTTLHQLIYQLCRDHPYHTMPVILALCNADQDSNPTRKSRSGEVSSQEIRKQAATKIVSKLLKSTSELNKYISQLGSVCLGYIELAYHNPEISDEFPENSVLLKPKEFNKVPVLTEEINVSKNSEYNNVIYVSSFEPGFKLCGGINRPKVITCTGSDGKKRQQLVKGRDDLRQDAVMQQVFRLVNRFLEKDPETTKRKMHIRTYKVVPLSARSGVLQWCTGTFPIGDYLAGSNYTGGAHKKYFPEQISALNCRKFLTNSQDKYAQFLEICKAFSPVFRYFFLENFVEPSVWYERRLAYTRSVATGSIVGYILGLGDRHVQNILVDKFTAEVIHIDLGVAFEQGHILATPETVPFRLTRDIVDGMGIAGVEGVFRKCCEKSMEVMRSSSESLLTILEVLLYDPLYVWSISPQVAASRQRRHDHFNTDNGTSQPQLDTLSHAPESPSAGEGVNKLAERVLLRLREKLQGVEDSVALSVPGQVSMLIQQAVDPRNLCRLFPGWQPYL